MLRAYLKSVTLFLISFFLLFTISSPGEELEEENIQQNSQIQRNSNPSRGRPTQTTELPGGSPVRGTPAGSPRPGGSRPADICPTVDTPLTALVANNGSDLTFQARPELWVYVPYSADQISRITFKLLDQRGRQTLYKSEVTLEDNAGLIHLNIVDTQNPHSEGKVTALVVDKLYRWSFSIYCDGGSNDEPDQIVRGWVRRISEPTQAAFDSNDYQTLRDNRIWYDVISIAANQNFQNCMQEEICLNNQIEDNWEDLLNILGYRELVDKPLVRSETVSVE